MYRRLNVLEIAEVVRLLRAGESDRKIVELLGLNRRTVAKNRTWAPEQNVLDGAVLPARRLQELLDRTLPKVVPPQQGSTVADYREDISALRRRGPEIAAIRTRLVERHQRPISYSAIWRLVQQLEPRQPNAVVQVEAKPGSEAQVDFGFASWVVDPTDRLLPLAI